MMIWLNDGPGSLAVEDGVVRAGDLPRLQALDECRRELQEQQDRLIQAARDEAQALLEQAHREAEALLERARAEAQDELRRGYEDGQRRAVMEWHDRQAGQTLDRAGMLRRMHEKLAGIVATAVERIVQSESREALYQRALHSVKSLTRGASSLALRVSAADYAHASAALASLPALAPHGLAVEVRVDPALKPGGCVFESDLGILDASLHTQLEGLRAAMDRAVRAALTEPDEGTAADEPGADPRRTALPPPELDDDLDSDLDDMDLDPDLADEEGALHG
jgi:type III secretion protein L